MMNYDKTQVDFWKTESWNYLQRNYGGKNFRDISLDPHLDRLLKAYPINIEGGSILEIGCGAGNNCYQLWKLLRANRGVGTEPSSESIVALSNVYPELEFYESDSRILPFKNAEFDLVILRSVLHWVDRDGRSHKSSI
jgi:ubiquinone/menaquinone biosynthesis C-methylase UbiE